MFHISLYFHNLFGQFKYWKQNLDFPLSSFLTSFMWKGNFTLCNVCGWNLITGLTSAASPRVDISSTCKVGQKLGVSLPLLTCPPLAWPSWLLYRRGRKSRRDLWITLYLLSKCFHVASCLTILQEFYREFPGELYKVCQAILFQNIYVFNFRVNFSCRLWQILSTLETRSLT